MTNPFVDATGAHRRIHALMTQDWSQPLITDQLGYDARFILARRQIRTLTADAVDRLYNYLRDKIGPASKVRYYAARNLYLSPHAWDHGFIDDPRHTAEIEALAVWLEVAPDPAITGGPMEHLLARLNTLLPREREAVARHAHTMNVRGDTRPVVLLGERLWQRDKWYRRSDRREGQPAA